VKLYNIFKRGNNIMIGNLLTILEPKPVKESRKLLFNILEEEKIDYERMRNTIGKTPTRFARKLDQNLKLSSSIFVASLVSVFLMTSGVWLYCIHSVANMLGTVVSDTNVLAGVTTGLLIISLIVFMASVLIGGFASFFLLRYLVRAGFRKDQ
jgi:hypothetical protein